MSVSSGLYESLVFIAITAKNHRQPGHPFMADQTNLNRPLAAIRHNRGKTGLGKIDDFDRPAAPLQNLAQG